MIHEPRDVQLGSWPLRSVDDGIGPEAMAQNKTNAGTDGWKCEFKWSLSRRHVVSSCSWFCTWDQISQAAVGVKKPQLSF